MATMILTALIKYAFTIGDIYASQPTKKKSQADVCQWAQQNYWCAHTSLPMADGLSGMAVIIAHRTLSGDGVKGAL